MRFDEKFQLLEFDNFSCEKSVVNFWNIAVWRTIQLLDFDNFYRESFWVNNILWSISIKAEGSTAKINIIVKPRDSNEVLTQNTNDFSKNSWDYEKNSIYGVVKHSSAASDYSFGVVPVPDGSQPWNNDHDLHMRFNEVEKTETNKNSQQSEHSYGTFNGITEDGANNHLRFNEVENEESEDQDIHTWRNNNDYIDNTIHWSPYGDVSDYPNNQAKSKVRDGLI